MKSINYLQEAVILALASVSVLGSIYAYNNYIEPRRSAAPFNLQPEASESSRPLHAPIERERKNTAEKPDWPDRQESGRASAKGGGETTAQNGDDPRIKALEQKISQLEGQLKSRPAATATARDAAGVRSDSVSAHASATAGVGSASTPARDKPAASKPAVAAAATDAVADDSVLELAGQAERVIRGGPSYWPQLGLNAWNKLLAALDSKRPDSKASAVASRELVDVLDRLFDAGTQALLIRGEEFSASERERLVSNLSRGRKYIGEARIAKLQALARRQAASEASSARSPPKAAQAKATD